MIAEKKRPAIPIAAAAALLTALALWTAWGNTALQLNVCEVSSGRLPEAFDGYRIAHVSDLHNAEMGEGNSKLLALIEEAAPDIIAITGDLIDSRTADIEIALQFVEEAGKIAPCYYVAGNHEARVPGYVDLRSGLIELAATVLEDERAVLEKNGDAITVIGVNDPSFKADYLFGDAESVMRDCLRGLAEEGDGFTLLLSHRPELFNVYAESGADLILSGHAHGGQFRLPFVGGLVAPNQGLFPEYDAGLYVEAGTIMVVSRGIGNSIVPFRFNNRPEVVLVELRSEGA